MILYLYSPIKLLSQYPEHIPVPHGFQIPPPPPDIQKWKHLPVSSNLSLQIFLNGDINVELKVVYQETIVLEQASFPFHESKNIIQFTVQQPAISCKYIQKSTNSQVLKRFQIVFPSIEVYNSVVTALSAIGCTIKGARMGNSPNIATQVFNKKGNLNVLAHPNQNEKLNSQLSCGIANLTKIKKVESNNIPTIVPNDASNYLETQLFDQENVMLDDANDNSTLNKDHKVNDCQQHVTNNLCNINDETSVPTVNNYELTKADVSNSYQSNLLAQFPSKNEKLFEMFSKIVNQNPALQQEFISMQEYIMPPVSNPTQDSKVTTNIEVISNIEIAVNPEVVSNPTVVLNPEKNIAPKTINDVYSTNRGTIKELLTNNHVERSNKNQNTKIEYEKKGEREKLLISNTNKSTLKYNSDICITKKKLREKLNDEEFMKWVCLVKISIFLKY